MDDTERSTRTRTRLAPDVRREQVLDAAERTILTRGIASTTMDDVAREAGVAKGTVYLYVDSRDDLLVVLRARFAQRLAADIEALLPVGGKGSRGRRLDAYVRGLADAYSHRHELFHALFQDRSASTGVIIDAAREPLRRFVEDGAAAGEFDVPDAEVAAEYCLWGIHGTLTAAAHHPDGPAAAVAALQRLARRALGA